MKRTPVGGSNSLMLSAYVQTERLAVLNYWIVA